MRHSGLIVLAAAAAVVCGACGGLSSSPPAGSHPAPSRAAGYILASCGYSDIVTARHPKIEIEPPATHTWRVVRTNATAMLPCGTKLRATHNGTADIGFSGQAVCKLGADPYRPRKTAILTTREPSGSYFNQGAGETWCTIAHSSGAIPLCGIGIMFLTGGTVQATATCNKEPDFVVAVLTGTVRVTDPARVSFKVKAGQKLKYYPKIRKSVTSPANFSASDVATFAAQAQAMNLPVVPAPQTITFTSKPPVNPAPGKTYAVTATGGGSGNPVIFTIDPVSGKACRISQKTNTVTFILPGTCVIDANQAGVALFQPAVQAQQRITVA